MENRGKTSARRHPAGKDKLRHQFLMFRELLREPRDIGTLCPSSAALADKMADAISPSVMGSGFLIELGAGTGPVTEALLRRGIPRERMIVVEKSEPLANCLSTRFLGVKIVCCGAEELRRYVGRDDEIRAVVSSLPFRSLPTELCESIMSVIEDILAPGGLYVQFTYALLGKIPFVPENFRRLRSDLVLSNIPPARVEVFRKPKNAPGPRT